MCNVETQSTGGNTPESENAYHNKQLMEAHHTAVMREKSVNKVIDEDCEIEKVKAPIPAKNDNIYNWSDDAIHTKRTTTVIGWIDELFARINGGPCKNRYGSICTCRKICEISSFGMRLCEGKPHYECVQAIELKLDEYLTR